MFGRRFNAMARLLVTAAIIILPAWITFTLVHNWVFALTSRAFLGGLTAMMLAVACSAFVLVVASSIAGATWKNW